MDKKMERMLKRHELAKVDVCQWWDIVLPEDLLATAFDSNNQWQSFTTLSIEDQQKATHGIQYLNSMDGYNPVLIGDFADSACAEKPLQLTLPIEFAECFKYHELLARSKRMYEVTFESEQYFEIERIGIRVLNAESKHDIYSNAVYKHVCGGKILVQTICRADKCR
jgi:hypothetical protein